MNATPSRRFGHRAVVPPLRRAAGLRVDPEALAVLRAAGAADVADAVGPLYVMDPAIHALAAPAPVAGTALTVKAVPGDNLAIHGALSLASTDDVLVVDWRGYTGGCGSGAQSLRVPFEHGLRGVVVDGGWRDVDELTELRFPVFGRSVSPWSPPKHHPGEVNVPVHCGGVVVSPGDIVVADVDGVAVVPVWAVDHVLDHLRRAEPAATDLHSREQRSAHRADRYQAAFEAAGGIDVGPVRSDEGTA